MDFGLYVRQGMAFIPTAGVTEAGYYLDLDPVEVARVDDLAALEIALSQTIRRGQAS